MIQESWRPTRLDQNILLPRRPSCEFASFVFVLFCLTDATLFQVGIGPASGSHGPNVDMSTSAQSHGRAIKSIMVLSMHGYFEFFAQVQLGLLAKSWKKLR